MAIILRIIFIVGAVFVSGRAAAQPFCDVRTFTLQEGLPSNTVSDITQTPDDLIWFGTWNGLCFFDGYRFTSFRNNPGESLGLSINRILQAKASVTNDVWCSTYDRHLYLLDSRTCTLHDISATYPDEFSRNFRVWRIIPLANGYTWVFSNDTTTAYRFDDRRVRDGLDHAVECIEAGSIPQRIVLDSLGREWLFTAKDVRLYKGATFSTPYRYMEQAGTTQVLATDDGRMAELRQGENDLRPLTVPDGISRINGLNLLDSVTVLAATDRGVLAYDVTTRRMRLISVQSPAQPVAEVTAVRADSQGRIWAYTPSAGITMVDADGIHWLDAQSADPLRRTTTSFPFVHEDSLGTVWVVPRGGTFSYYDADSRQLVAHPLYSQGRDNYYLPEMQDIFFDRHGNLWFAGQRNVSLLNFCYTPFHYHFASPNNEVRSLIVDRQGRIWAGSQSGQITVYDSTYTAPPRYLAPDGTLRDTPVTFAVRVYGMMEDRHGRIWVASKSNGVYVVELGRSVRQYTYNADDPWSLSNNDVYNISTDAAGRIWISTFDGGINLVSEQPDGTIRFINHRNRLKQYPMNGFSRVRCITHTRDSVALVSTINGLLTFSTNFKNPEDIRFYVNRYDEDDPSGLLSLDVMQSLVLHDGHVIVVTMHGGVQKIISPNLLQENIRFETLETVGPNESIMQSVAEDVDGSLWFVREGGLEHYSMEHGTKQSFSPNDLGDDATFSECLSLCDTVSRQVLVGSFGGFFSFRPDQVHKNQRSPRMVFTGVFFQGDETIRPLLHCETLRVPADKRTLTIFFAALDYRTMHYPTYSYMVEGVDASWISVGGMNSTMLSYLPAGHHRLLVRSTNSEGVWLDNVAALDIYVEPTLWETWWMRLLIAVAVLLLVAAAVVIGKKKIIRR